MERKITIPGELSLAMGLALISFAVTLMVHADFGISTISSLPYALSVVFDELSFGVWNPIFQICLLGVLLVIAGRLKRGYAVSFFISLAFGLVLDIFAALMSGLPSGTAYRALYFAASYPIMCVAIALMVNSKVPLMIVDSFINDIAAHYHITFRRAKTIFDIACVTLSVALSMAFLGHLAGVGVGTVIMALITGSGVHAANGLLGRAVVIRPWSRTLGRLVE